MKITKITPQHERVLVKLHEVKSVTEGGIELPDDARDVPNIGNVFSMGPKAVESLPDVKEGDTVMLMKFAGMEVKIGNEIMQLVMANDIIAKLEVE